MLRAASGRCCRTAWALPPPTSSHGSRGRAAEFASLAPLVVETAAAGDPHARSLLDEAAGHRVSLARALAATATEQLVLAGGLAEIFRAPVAAALGPALDQSGRVPSPLDGALLIARGLSPAEFPEA
ncbi:MAG: hypothetical protein R3D25_15850 [Geminicoccaceae bacterium]